MIAAAAPTQFSRDMLHDRRILVIEDNELVRREMTELLQAAGAPVIFAVATCDYAVQMLREQPIISGVLADWNLGNGTTSFAAVQEAQARKIPVIVCSGDPGSVFGVTCPVRHKLNMLATIAELSDMIRA